MASSIQFPHVASANQQSPNSGDNSYASFRLHEAQFVLDKTGEFANPVVRASKFLTMIEHLLSSSDDQQSDLAFELHREALRKGVWAPKGVVKEVYAECFRIGIEADHLIKSASQPSDTESSSDEETDDEYFEPRDRSEALADQYHRKTDFYRKV